MKTKKPKPMAKKPKEVITCYWCRCFRKHYPSDIPTASIHQANCVRGSQVEVKEPPPVVFVPSVREWTGKKMVANPVDPMTANEDNVPVELLGTDDKSIGFWCESLRDEHEAKGEHLKVSGLIQYAMSLRQRPYAERCALRDAIQRIYADERGREHTRDNAWLQRVQTRTEQESDSEAPSVASDERSRPQRRGAQQQNRDAQTQGEQAPKAKSKPGVIAKIIEVLTSASKKRPVTKDQILDTLVKTFPERTREAMRGTVGSQVPKGLFTEKKIVVRHTDDKSGWWIRKPKQED